ncbi:MAG: SDR family NAD(P)-dependent oxidoreductase [Acidimicrobiia bacterium]
MENFDGRLAVVTGGGTGMGRELVIQLAAEGCSVATCDLFEDVIAETAERALKEAPAGTKVTTHLCDMSDAAQVERFRDEVVAQHATDHVNLVFNNAGVGGGGSFIAGDRGEWERTFDIDWGGVYNGCRSFVPLLIASDDGYLVNTSSVNGFWASIGPGRPHTAYSAAKFAVKGFTEALIEDFAVNAPHVKCAVVMPGHIGTDIVLNSRKVLAGSDVGDLTDTDIDGFREQMGAMLPDTLTNDQIRELIKGMGEGFRDNAPLSAAQAATIILDGVRAEKWRILVGDDAHRLDQAVRANPEGAYGPGGLDLLNTILPGN